MPEMTVNSIDKSLAMLLNAQNSFKGYSLDICTGYISTSGIMLLKNMLKEASKIRAVIGLNNTNKVVAFQVLRDEYEAEVYVYVTGTRSLFHPKIYVGTQEAQIWAMIGSSNFTESGLSLNIEHNLFITGQRHVEPFVSIETQINTFYNQAYLFDKNMEAKLLEVEREAKNKNGLTYDAYRSLLYKNGIKPKFATAQIVPIEAQQIALSTLFEFAEYSKLEYAYQMLLLLFMLDYTDQDGQLSIRRAAHYFADFYKKRREAGLQVEIRYNGNRGRSVVDRENVSIARIVGMLKESPFPRFERKGLLDLSDDREYFIVNRALQEALIPELKEQLRALANRRINEHFAQIGINEDF
jgi:HKD family nuclease